MRRNSFSKMLSKMVSLPYSLRLSCDLESVRILLLFSNFRTGMYGKGGTSLGWRIDAGCVMMR